MSEEENPIFMAISFAKSFITRTFLLVLLGLTTLTIAIGLWIWQDVKNDRFEDLNKTAVFLNNFYELTFLQRELGLTSVGERMLAIDGPDQVRERLSVAMNAISSHTEFMAIGLVDTTGQLITFTGSLDQKNLPNLAKSEKTRRTFEQVKKARNIILGEAYFFDEISNWILPIRVPIRNENGQLLAVNTSAISINTLLTELDNFNINENYQVQLINEDFNSIQLYYPLKAGAYDIILHQNANIYQDYKTITQEAGIDFFEAYNTIEKNNQIGARSTSNALNHFVVVTVDSSILWQAYRGTFFVILSIYLTGITLVLIAFNYFAKKEQRFENALARERFYSESIINATTALIVGLDADLKCRFINPALERLTGYTKQDLHELNWWRLIFPAWWKLLSSGKEISELSLMLDTVIKSNRENFEMELITKSGEKKNILWNYVEIKDAGSAAKHIIGFGIDMTAQRSIEKISMEREANLLSIVESTNNIIGLFDTEYRIIEFNKAFDTYAKNTDNITLQKGMAVLDNMNRPQAALFKSLLSRAFKGEKISQVVEYPNGSDKFYFLMNYNPIYQGEKITGASLFVQDITELRNAQEALKKYATNLEGLVNERSQQIVEANTELNKRNEELSTTLANLQKTQNQLIQSEKMASLGLLSAGVAHEINNPLNFIKGGSNALASVLKEADPKAFEEAAPLIDIINEGVNRATAIVKGLSHFSRQNEAKTEQINLHQVLDNCLVILNNRFKHKVKITKNYTDSLPILMGNEGQLHQAFLNILSNAEQAIEKVGEISVATTITNDRIIVKIKDSGSGISPENLSRISDPFFTTKAPGEGTGLGLSITYKIIKDHGGSIEVHSDLGKGTEFVVLLPC